MPAIALVIFLLSLFVIELSFHAYNTIRYPDRTEIRKRLKTTVMDASADGEADLTKKRVLSEIPFLNRILPYVPGAVRMDLLIRQANLKYTVGFFFLSSICLAFTAYLFVSTFTSNPLLSASAAFISASLPSLYVRLKKKKRMDLFERQLPDGLGLISRALRAGHAFTSGMKLAADEFGDPLGPELAETLDEINFGVTVPDALKNLAGRVDCPDMNFFVVSVILQRETGGNLAELLEKLASLIRERFKFRGKVRTLTAEGRLSAVVLLMMPFAAFGILFLFDPSYVMSLIDDPIGKALSGAAGFMMIIGIIIIRRMIRVEV
ncbi:MAG: pilus assembly protein [Desulfobacteraceae bacterium]|nr:MAG: pilus assembly protein [Desulfobacteraceae bacterium]